MSFFENVNTDKVNRDKNLEDQSEYREHKEKTNRLKESADKKQATLIEYSEQIEDNVKVSERLRAEINKDISDKRPIRQILDKALLTISLMTGDSVFYRQNSKKIKEL